MTPFRDWIALIDRLPDGLRRLRPATSVPPKGRIRLVLPEAAVLIRPLPRPEVPPERRAAWIEARLEPLSPWAPGAFLWAEVPGEPFRVALTAAAPVRALQAAHPGRIAEVQIGPARLVLRPLLPRLRFWAGLWAAAMALGIGLGLWALWVQTEAEAARLLAEERLARVVSQAARQGEQSRAALDLVKAAPLGPVLDRLAIALPPDSYLLTLRLEPGKLTISGLSAAPEAVVPALQGAGFSGVSFAGASALDGASGLYTFTLAGGTE